MRKQPIVYIVTNFRNGTIYVGVTSDLIKRMYQHRNGVFKGFTKKHQLNRLVWYEAHETMESAITREKQLKNWKRLWKLSLIEENNPKWRDLAESLGFSHL